MSLISQNLGEHRVRLRGEWGLRGLLEPLKPHSKIGVLEISISETVQKKLAILRPTLLVIAVRPRGRAIQVQRSLKIRGFYDEPASDAGSHEIDLALRGETVPQEHRSLAIQNLGAEYELPLEGSTEAA